MKLLLFILLLFVLGVMSEVMDFEEEYGSDRKAWMLMLAMLGLSLLYGGFYCTGP